MIIEKLKSTEAPPMELLLSADPSRELVEKYLASGECFIAKRQDEIIAVYILLSIKSTVTEIMNIAVAKKEQGKGIGKELIKHAIEYARKQGYAAIEVGTGNSSLGQLALYQKCGFRINGIEYDFFTRNYEEEIIENGIICRDMIRLERKLT
ncbi:GNAT family N-acetyltransferase [Oceanobacillus sp. 143]|uniref:GNAT family N-acetyltransferase n=1 Tax=Oceanobacillus zhaokaii TaxID=2052660 RepID=A0A345PEX5_9BACI|nr:GNAT family N-acetyltransferase [Oceanobacillus zhaokaii]AXI08555.1 GNAT family N-acetyltransferase [Oceanobacillus zhaokaii]QGS68370.1 GNAT family N-acetyltransferase [Oceanobacillus sp. 143]